MNSSISYEAFLKSPYLSYKHSTYFKIYDELFSSYRGKSITFVEIGVLGGGSLFMWREFFGNNARIIGVDLNPGAKKWENYGFEIFIGNQCDKNFWLNFIAQVGQIDIILDDGGHTYLQQIVTSEMLLPHINDNGMLVIEDTHTSYMSGFGPRRYSFMNYVENMIEKINYRFGQLNKKQSEKRVWSIQCFESFVAFHINKHQTNLLSYPTSNNGIDDMSTDYRHYEDSYFEKVSKIKQFLNFLHRIPGLWYLGRHARIFFQNWTISAFLLKKYF